MVNTQTSLTATPATAGLGSPVTLTAVVTADLGIASGTVSFFAGTNPMGAAFLDDMGTATIQTARLPLGTLSLTASFVEGGDFLSSTSPAVPFTVTQAATAVVINDIIADEYSNSYVDVDYADNYWDQHWDVNSAAQWAALTDARKTSLLVQACRIIETLRFTEPVDPLSEFHLIFDSRNQQIRSAKTNFGRPEKYYYQQKLQFPRTIEVHMDGTLFIPEEIMFAQCEQTVYMLNFDQSILANRLQGISHDALTVGGIQISQKLEAKGSMISPVAYNYCKPYLLRRNLRLQRS